MTVRKDRKEVLVLIAADLALRSTLVGRLSMQGETVMTFEDAPQFLAARRPAPRPAVLIIEGIDAADYARVVAHHSWDLVLAVRPPAAAAPGSAAVVRLEHADALTIPERLAEWRRARRPAE